MHAFIHPIHLFMRCFRWQAVIAPHAVKLAELETRSQEAYWGLRLRFGSAGPVNG